MWQLLPLMALEPVVRVLEFGMLKYARDNWQQVPEAKDRYYRAMLGHLFALQEKPNDDESGLSHMAHAVCCGIFWLWFDRHAK
jgi:hypothetical protein